MCVCGVLVCVVVIRWQCETVLGDMLLQGGIYTVLGVCIYRVLCAYMSVYL